MDRVPACVASDVQSSREPVAGLNPEKMNALPRAPTAARLARALSSGVEMRRTLFAEAPAAQMSRAALGASLVRYVCAPARTGCLCGAPAGPSLRSPHWNVP